MKLVLDEDFYIEGGLNSFTLYYYHVSEELNATGNPVVSKDQWYYPTIRDCLMSYLDRGSGIYFGTIPAVEIVKKYDELIDKIGGIKEFVWNSQNDEMVRLKEEIKELKK